MLNMCQISSLMAAAEGPVAEFSSFANWEEKKRKSNLLMSFPKTANQMGSFGQIRKKLFFRFCRPILDIFGLTLLSITQFVRSRVTTWSHGNVIPWRSFINGCNAHRWKWNFQDQEMHSSKHNKFISFILTFCGNEKLGLEKSLSV